MKGNRELRELLRRIAFETVGRDEALRRLQELDECSRDEAVPLRPIDHVREEEGGETRGDAPEVLKAALVAFSTASGRTTARRPAWSPREVTGIESEDEEDAEQPAVIRTKVRGFFGIGVYGSKTVSNVGTLWRSAYAMGASYIFTIGRRWPQQASDTVKAWRHVPYLEFSDMDDFIDHLPLANIPIAVEFGVDARPLPNFTHPERAAYILGAEDTGIPAAALSRCAHTVYIPTSVCLNVAVAGSIIMYDRRLKEGQRCASSTTAS